MAEHAETASCPTVKLSYKKGFARVRDDSCCRVEDTLQLVGRLARSANQETAAIIDSARDKRMNECSNRVVIQRTSDAA